jgi:hypothetical protein
MDRFNLALGQKREVFYSLGQVKPDDRDGTYETKSRPKSLQNFVRFELLRALRWNPGQLDNLDRFRLLGDIRLICCDLSINGIALSYFPLSVSPWDRTGAALNDG